MIYTFSTQIFTDGRTKNRKTVCTATEGRSTCTFELEFEGEVRVMWVRYFNYE